MARPPISRLFDHTARIWRPTTVRGPIREDVTTFVAQGDVIGCAVNRPAARLGDPGPGLTNIGERTIYTETAADIQPRDVLELLTGPETGRKLEIDEEPTNVRDHHKEARARIYAGLLGNEDTPEGES